jgi:hypothetical protein
VGSLVSLLVDASDTATYALGERFQVRISWSYGTLPQIETIYFDVVLEPYSFDVDLSDLVAEVADMEERLGRQATASDSINVRTRVPVRFEVRRGANQTAILFYPQIAGVGWAAPTGTPTYTLHKPDGTQITSGSCTVTAISTTAGKTAQTQAAIYAMLAWGDTQALVKAHCEAKGRIRARLIIDQEQLRQVVIAYALARAYIAEGGALDSESRLLAADWKAEAAARFAALGELDYDESEDRIADDTLGGWGVTSMARRW